MSTAEGATVAAAGSVRGLFSLSGQTVVVTGAASGIGRAIALGLADVGADVACVDRNPDGLADTVASITSLGRAAGAFEADVTDAAAIESALAQVESSLGPITVAVNCAGIASAAPAEDLDQTEWDRVIAVNLTGVFLSCRAEGRLMLDGRGGSIINIASMSGVIVNRGLTQVHYNASKAGVIHLSKSLAMEWVGRGVRVNSISPGYTATPMNTRPEVAEQVKTFEAETPMGRMATVDEMVGPAVFLATRASSFCTGVDLLVDGGFCCW